MPSTRLRGILAWRMGTLLRFKFNAAYRESNAKLAGYDDGSNSLHETKERGQAKKGILTKGSKP